MVRLSALGDVIHALPVPATLRREVPGVRVDWVVEDRAADILRDRGDLDRIVVFPRRELRNRKTRPVAWLRTASAFVRDLRAVTYDATLDLQGNLKSGVIARLSRAGVRLGPDRRSGREFNHLFSTRRALPPSTARHRVEQNLSMVGALLGRVVTWEPPGLDTSSETRAGVDALLAEAGLPGSGYVVLHPGTSGFGAFKRWPPERFADLADRLADRDLAVAVTYAPGEEDVADAVLDATHGAAKGLLTPDLRVLTEVVRRARHFVSGDTGPLHLAALAGVPLVGLFGPKDPEIYGPWGRRPDDSPGLLAVAARHDVPCRPCPYRRCAAPVCMTGLTPEAVLASME